MGFHAKCEDCGNDMHKTWDTLSTWQSVMSGGIVECEHCKARYKSKYKTSFFDGLVPLDMVFVPVFAVFFLVFWDEGLLFMLVFPLIIYQAFVHIGEYLIPLRKISKEDEEFWDIKQKD